MVAGLYLVWVGGVPALLIGVASLLASLAYSWDPFPLGDRALGDPLCFVFFGVVSVVGTYYMQAASVLGPRSPTSFAIAMWMRGASVEVLLPLLTLPYGVLVARGVWARQGCEPLIPMTPQAGQLALAFSVLFGLGLALQGAG